MPAPRESPLRELGAGREWLEGGGHAVPMAPHEAHRSFRLAAERDHPYAEMMMGRYLARDLAANATWSERSVGWSGSLRRVCEKRSGTGPCDRRRPCRPSRSRGR